MAGRKKDYVWQDVTLTEDDKASCNYCDAIISKRPIRIKDHLKKCRKNPANRKQDTPESPEMDIPDTDNQIKWTSFMVNLHSCPSSSASLERWFSTFGFVWSKTRNRLGQEKAMKLVKIYRALRSDDSNPFSFLHTFSCFLYFHMLSSS